MTAPRTLPDARWSCRACGACCRGFSFGPVEPEIIKGLQEADIAALWPPAAEGAWHHYQPGPDGKPAAYLAHRDGHCVFLREDNLCAIHGLLGSAAKPWFCREYPFQAVEDAAGVAVTVRADCGGLPESFADGDPVAPQAAAALELPRIVPRPRFAPAQVVILPGLAISAENWLQISPHLLAALEPPRPPEQAVAAARGMLYRLANRPEPAVDKAEYPQILAAALAHLRRAAALAEQQPLPPGMGAKIREASGVLASAADALAGGLPALDEPAQRYLGLVLRGELLTHRFGTLGGLPEGLGLHLLEAAVARLAAPGAPPLAPSQVGAILPSWRRLALLPPLWDGIRGARPLLAALATHAG